MDAKKMDKFYKPKLLKDTKTFKYANIIATGLTIFTLVSGYCYYRFWGLSKENIPFSFLYGEDPEKRRLQRAYMLGVLPPPKEVIEKLQKYLNQ